MNKPKLLFISNLYRLPWLISWAAFNQQQIQHLNRHFEIKAWVPVPFVHFFRHRAWQYNDEHTTYFPYWFTPKVGRRFYHLYMSFSLSLQRRAINKFNPDFMFTAWGYPDAVAAVRLAKQLNVPVTVKLHGSDVNDRLAVKTIQKTAVNALNEAQSVYCVSNHLAGQLTAMGVDGSRVRTLYNGIDHQRFYIDQSQQREAGSFLYVGNLKASKGVIDLLKAFIGLELKHKKLVLVGSGPDQNLLSAMAQDHKVEHLIEFTGRLPHAEIAKKMQRSQVIALASHNEGVPNILLEAMACGTPVVSTDVGGVAEVVPSFAGLLVPAHDVAAFSGAMAKAVSTIWDHQAINEHAQQFDWSKNAVLLSQLITNTSKEDISDEVVIAGP